MEYILVLDVGTTSVKAALFDETLRQTGCISSEYSLITTADKHIEYPAERYWEAVCKATASLSCQLNTASHIAGITVTTQGETMIPVDTQGVPLRNAIVWLDDRADSQAEIIRRKIPQEQFYRATGIPECNGLCPVSKLLWLKENEPDLYRRTRYLLLLGDYILYRLTGIFCSEKTLLSTTGYFRIDKDTLWDDLLTELGLDADKIPPMRECGDVIGAITGEAAAMLGLGNDATVTAGAMDQTCAALGAGNFTEGMLTEVTGTALCLGATIPKKAIGGSGKVPVYRHINSGSYLVLSVCMTAGMALKWFKDTFCQHETEQAAEERRDVYDILSEHAASSPPLAKGLLHVPYLAGSIQPANIPEARGVFTGIGLEHTKDDFIRAIFEGVGYMLRENIELFREEFSLTGSTLRSLGGGSRSSLWNQIKADITGLPIETMTNSECTAAGAACLCAHAIGLCDTLGKAVFEANRPTGIYQPELNRKADYERGYAQYKKMIAAIYR